MKNSSLFRLKSDTKRVRECDTLARAQVIKRNTARFQRHFLPSFSLSLSLCVCVCLSLSFSEKSLSFMRFGAMCLKTTRLCLRFFASKSFRKKRRRETKRRRKEDKKKKTKL